MLPEGASFEDAFEHVLRKLGGKSARDRRLFADRGPEAGDKGGGWGAVTLWGRGEHTDSDGGERDRGRGGNRLPELSATARCARCEDAYTSS